jgi:hypothetical protein
MTIEKVDITLSSRAARHLFMITVISSPFLILAGVFWTWWFWRVIFLPFSMYYYWLGLLLSFSLITGSAFALYYARRELNYWAYAIAALCAVLLLIIFGNLLFASPPENATDKAARAVEIFILFIILYMLRVLVDFVRLARNKYDVLNTSPLGLANAVSRMFRDSRSAVSSIHMPTNPIRAIIYSVLFVLLLPVVFSDLIPVPFVGYVPLVFLAAMARRHYVRRADSLLKLDARRPILFLRSFTDDKVRLLGKGVHRQISPKNHR